MQKRIAEWISVVFYINTTFGVRLMAARDERQTIISKINRCNILPRPHATTDIVWAWQKYLLMFSAFKSTPQTAVVTLLFIETRETTS